MTDDVDDRESKRADASTGGDARPEVPEEANWTLQVQVPFDEGADHDLTSAIVVAVAEAEGVSPMDVKEPPLYEVLDVVALEESLFGSSTIGRADGNSRSVEFLYRDHRVVIRSDAWVQVYDAAEG